MAAYWVMYLIPALPALVRKSVIEKNKHLITWFIIGIVFTLFIGFRHQVGGDWSNYLYTFKWFINTDLKEAITYTDPGYAFINWLMAYWGYEIYAVNLVCGAIFMTGLLVFARRQPYPWIALAVAVPYIITVVAMGYSRQGVALGFLFMALNSLELNRFKSYISYIILATLFHSTALVLIPLGLFLYSKTWPLRAIAILLLGYWFWDLLIAEKQEIFWEAYVEAQMQSQGARIRVFMNLVPSLLLIFYWKKWKKSFPNYGFWMALALGSLASVVMVNFASTAVDRVALYFTPLQVVVFSRLPYLARRQIEPGVLKTGIIFGYALVHFVWLNYATHARFWLPYQNMLFL